MGSQPQWGTRYTLPRLAERGPNGYYSGHMSDPYANNRPADRKRMATSFGPFKRLLGYVWPQKRYLTPAIGCIVLMAVTYSVSLGSIPFVLTVLMRPQGLHGWVAQTIAEKRLKAQFSVYNSLEDVEVPGVPEGAARVLDLNDDSPLNQAGVKRGAFILQVDKTTGKATDVFPAMAYGQRQLELQVFQAETGRRQSVPVPLEDVDLHYRALAKLVSIIPGGLTPAEKWRTLITVLGLLAVVVLIGNIARFWAEYLTVLVNCRAIMDLRRQMYAHILRLPLSHFSRNTTDTMSRFVQDSNDIFRGLSNFFEKVVTEPFKAVGAAAVALYLDWQLTVVVLITTPLAALLIRKLGKQIRRANRKVLMSYSKMLGALESTLTGMRVVKGYGRENYERRRLFRIDRTVLSHQLGMGRTEALASPFLEMLAFVAVAAAILYFGSEVLADGGEDKMPGFLGMIFCLVAIFDPIRKLTTVYPKIQRANAAAERVFEVIDSPSEDDSDVSRPRLAPLQKSIEFDQVGFVYPGTTRPALEDVSLTVRVGETIALVGPNGSGKTTLVSLLPRFFPLSGGHILIDGQDTSEVSLRSLREQFSLITQESVIFPDTIRSNIAYGRLDASQEEIEAAARKAFADEFIRQMPQGYDTVVGEHGATLSGGQRQRIAIARAILRDAPILIFDEATSQVDPESEMKIHQALDNFIGDRTAFIIAHRYSTVRNADRIVVMDEGRIEAVGPHDELLRTCPLYLRLYENQFRNSEEAAAHLSKRDAAADADPAANAALA